MAKDLFTSPIQTNAPGLAYSTPKSMPASYNSLGGIAEGLNTVIPAIDAYNKSSVESEAATLANELANEYKLGSETHISNLSQEKVRLQSEVNAGDNSSEIVERLSVIEGKLNNAVNQGAIGPGEFKHRMRKAAQDLTNDNPAYQMEIASKMNAVFGATGINDILALDSTLLKTRADAIIARRTLKTKLVEQYQDTSTMTEEAIDSKYAFFKDLEGIDKQVQLVTNSMKNQNDQTKQKAYRTFLEAGGYKKLSDGIYSNATRQIRAIGAMPDVSIAKKIQQTNDYLNKTVNMLLVQASVLPSDAKEGTFITTNLINQINVIKTEMLEESNQVNALKNVQNKVAMLVGQNEYNLNKKYNIPEIDTQVKFAGILENLESTGVDIMKQNHQLRDNLIASLSTQINGAYGATTDTPGFEMMASPDGAGNLAQMTIDNRENARKDLEKNGKLTDGNVNLYVSSFSLPRSSLSKDTLLTHYDKYLYQNIMSTDEKVMDALEQYPEYNTEVDNALSAYTMSAVQSLRQIIGDNTVSVSFNKTNSSLFIKQDDPIRVNQPGAVTRFQNNLQRVNRLIRMNAKISGKSLEEEAKKILEEDFNTVLKAE